MAVGKTETATAAVQQPVQAKDPEPAMGATKTPVKEPVARADSPAAPAASGKPGAGGERMAGQAVATEAANQFQRGIEDGAGKGGKSTFARPATAPPAVGDKARAGTEAGAQAPEVEGPPKKATAAKPGTAAAKPEIAAAKPGTAAAKPASPATVEARGTTVADEKVPPSTRTDTGSEAKPGTTVKPAPKGKTVKPAVTDAQGAAPATDSEATFKAAPRPGAKLPTAAEVEAAAAEEAKTRAAAPAIPDAMGVAANKELRYEALNKEINKGYAQFANIFQEIVDPGFKDRGTSNVRPVWFALAPYASREVGRGLTAAKAAEATINRLPPSVSSLGDLAMDQLRGPYGKVRPDGEDALNAVAAQLDMKRRGVNAGNLLQVGAFYMGLPVPSPRVLDAGNLEANKSVRTAVIGAARAKALVDSAPGTNLKEKAGAVVLTLRNALEDGNRRIYEDIGGAGQRYLEWRRGSAEGVSPEQVLNTFASGEATRVGAAPEQAREQARAMYDVARLAVERGQGHGMRVDQLFPSPPNDLGNATAAGFALYEQAARTADPKQKDELIAWGNNFLAYREQHDAVQPGFEPGGVLPGEVERMPLMQMLTPTVTLPLKDGAWNFADYANRRPGRDNNPLTPPVTEYNWGRFEDRWAPILDAFEAAYAKPSALWPMPGADPSAP